MHEYNWMSGNASSTPKQMDTTNTKIAIIKLKHKEIQNDTETEKKKTKSSPISAD